MTKRIFLSTITVVVSVLLLSLALITGVLYEHFQKIQMDQLEVTEEFVEQGITLDGMDY